MLHSSDRTVKLALRYRIIKSVLDIDLTYIEAIYPKNPLLHNLLRHLRGRATRANLKAALNPDYLHILELHEAK